MVMLLHFYLYYVNQHGPIKGFWLRESALCWPWARTKSPKRSSQVRLLMLKQKKMSIKQRLSTASITQITTKTTITAKYIIHLCARECASATAGFKSACLFILASQQSWLHGVPESGLKSPLAAGVHFLRLLKCVYLERFFIFLPLFVNWAIT